MADFGKYDKNGKGMDFEQFRSKLDSDDVKKNESLKKFFGIFDTENRNGVIDTDAERNSLFSKVKYYAGEDGILQDSEITEMLNSEPDMQALKDDKNVFDAVKNFFGGLNKPDEQELEKTVINGMEIYKKDGKIVKKKNGDEITEYTYNKTENGEEYVTITTPTSTINVSQVEEDGTFIDENFINEITKNENGEESIISKTSIKTSEGNRICICKTDIKGETEATTTIYNTDSIYMYKIFKDSLQMKLGQVSQKDGKQYFVYYDENGNTVTHTKNGDSVSRLTNKFDFQNVEEFYALNPDAKDKTLQVGQNIVVPNMLDATDERIIAQGDVYEELNKYSIEQFRTKNLQNISKETFNTLNKVQGFELNNENVVMYFKFNALNSETQQKVLDTIETLSKQGKTPDEIKEYFLQDENAPQEEVAEGVTRRINLCDGFTINLRAFDGESLKGDMSVKGFVEKELGLDIKEGEGKELYDALCNISDGYTASDIVEMFSNIKYRSTADYKKSYSEQVKAYNGKDESYRKSVLGRGDATALRNNKPLTQEEAKEMYKAVIQKLTAPEGTVVKTKYDDFIENHKDSYLREFTADMVAMLHGQGAEILTSTGAQKDILQLGKYVLAPIGKFYDKKGAQIYDKMQQDCYLGNDKLSSTLEAYSMGLHTAGVKYDKAKIKQCYDIFQNPNSTEAQKKKAMEDAFGTALVNTATELVNATNFIDGATDMVLLLYGTGAISKVLTKGVAFASKGAKLTTTAARAIKGGKNAATLSERLLQVGTSATTFATWDSFRYTLNYFTNDIDESQLGENSYTYGEGLGKTAVHSAAFGAFAGAWGQLATSNLVKAVFKNPESTKVAQKAMSEVSNKLGKTSSFTSSQLLSTYQAAQAKAMQTFGKEALSFASETVGFSLYEIGSGALSGDIKIESMEDVGKVLAGQTKNLLSFKAMGKILFMHKNGQIPDSMMKLGKDKELKIENKNGVFEVKYPDGKVVTAKSMQEVVGLSNAHYENVTLYEPLKKVLAQNGKLDLGDGVVIKNGNNGYIIELPDGKKVENKDLKVAMQEAQGEYQVYSWDNQLKAKGNVELPNKQTVTLENNSYKTTILSGKELEAGSLKDLLQLSQRTLLAENVEKAFEKQDTVQMGNMVIQKSKDGSYKAMVVSAKGEVTILEGNSVDEILTKYDETTKQQTVVDGDVTANNGAYQSAKYKLEGEIPAEEKLADGFINAEQITRNSEWNANQNIKRDIGNVRLKLDKQNDTALQNLIIQLKERVKNTTDEKQIAMEIYRYVLDLCGDTDLKEADKYNGKEFLLGDFVTNHKNAMTCNERAMLFKVLADEMNIQASYSSGYYEGSQGSGAHAWNCVKLSNGQELVFDTMHGEVVPTDYAQDNYFTFSHEPDNYYGKGKARYITKEPVEPATKQSFGLDIPSDNPIKNMQRKVRIEQRKKQVTETQIEIQKELTIAKEKIYATKNKSLIDFYEHLATDGTLLPENIAQLAELSKIKNPEILNEIIAKNKNKIGLDINFQEIKLLCKVDKDLSAERIEIDSEGELQAAINAARKNNITLNTESYAFKQAVKFESFKKYLDRYGVENKKFATELYNKYYLADKSLDVVKISLELSDKYGVFTFANDIRELQALSEELNEITIASNGNAQFHTVVDFSHFNEHFINKTASGISSGNTMCVDGYKKATIRHELIHKNDPFIDPIQDGCTYEELDAILAGKYIDEFRKAGIAEKGIKYAHTSRADYLSVLASEGDLSKISPEFRQVLCNHLGMPNWVFNLKRLDIATQLSNTAKTLKEGESKIIESQDYGQIEITKYDGDKFDYEIKDNLVCDEYGKVLKSSTILEGGYNADDLTEIAPFARRLVDTSQMFETENKIREIEQILIEKMNDKKSVEEKARIQSIIDKITPDNYDLINLMSADKNISNELMLNILESCTKPYKIGMLGLFNPVNIPIFTLQHFGIIGDIELNDGQKKKYAKTLVSDPNIPKDIIPGILQNLQNGNNKLLDIALQDKNFDFKLLPALLKNTLVTSSYYINEQKSVSEKRVKFASKLMNNPDFPNNCISDIIHWFNIENVDCNFVEKLCDNKDFPPYQIATLLENISHDRRGFGYLFNTIEPKFKQKLAERLVADEKCSNEFIADIIGSIDKSQEQLFEQLYSDKNIPQAEIASILYLDYGLKKGFEKLDIPAQIAVLTNSVSVSDNTLAYLKKYNIDKIEIDTLVDKISMAMGLKKENIPTNEQDKKSLFKNYISNNSNIEEVIRNIDLSKFSNGIPLKYSRSEFIKDIDKLLSDISAEDRSIILNYFGLKIESGKMEGFPIPSKNLNGIKSELLPIITQIEEKVTYFTKNNQTTYDNPELKEIFDSIIRGCPEFATIIGKVQHGTHKYTVDIHTLKVLQNAFKDPEYKMLDDESKTVIKFAILLHDIGKKEGVIDKTHYETSAKYAVSILDKYNLPARVKSRIIETIYNHHWFEQYNKNEISANLVNAIFRTPKDLQVGMIMAKADLAGVSDDFHYRITKTHNEEDFNTYFNKKKDELQAQQNARYQNSNLVMDTKFSQTGKRKFPTKIVSIKGKTVELPVLNLTDETLPDSLYEFGFGKDVTRTNARFFAHFNDLIKGLKIFMALSSSPTTESVQSLSMISLDNSKSYKNQTYGVITDVDMANIAQASSENISSGYKKNLKNFAKDLFGFWQVNTYVRDNLINELSIAGINLTKEEYGQLAKEIVSIQYSTQITKDIKIGDKIISADILQKAMNASRDALFEGQCHSEIVAINPRVKALVARVSSIEECSTEFLELATQNNLPIILIGHNEH